MGYTSATLNRYLRHHTVHLLKDYFFVCFPKPRVFAMILAEGPQVLPNSQDAFKFYSYLSRQMKYRDHTPEKGNKIVLMCSSRFVPCSSDRMTVSVLSVQHQYVSSADLSIGVCYCSVNTRWNLSADPPCVPHMSPLSEKLSGMTTPQSIWPWGTAAQRQESLLGKDKVFTFSYHCRPLCAAAGMSKLELRKKM